MASPYSDTHPRGAMGCFAVALAAEDLGADFTAIKGTQLGLKEAYGAVTKAQYRPTYRLVICVRCHTTSPLLMTDWRCDFALAGS